jgi:hypothetical protein
MNALRSALLALLGCAGCAGTPTGTATPTGPSPSQASGFETAASNARAQTALEALRARLERGEPEALSLAGVTLTPASGARELTGEPSPDERVGAARIVLHVADVAALLVESSCGNVTLATVRWDGERWVPATHLLLVAGMHPGRCAQTSARAEPVALTSDVRRELAVVVVSQDVTGGSVRGPFLSVYQPTPQGELTALLAEAPFGAMDDVTGATTIGEFSVIEDVPPPRALFISIHPGRPGPGGAPAQEIVRRRYVLRGGHLVLADQTVEPVE